MSEHELSQRAAAAEQLCLAASLQHQAASEELNAAEARVRAAFLAEQPSAIYRPRLFLDGNQWCALYGEDLQAGVAGFGDSPEAAFCDFDRAWKTKLPAHVRPSVPDLARKLLEAEAADNDPNVPLHKSEALWDEAVQMARRVVLS